MTTTSFGRALTRCVGVAGIGLAIGLGAGISLPGPAAAQSGAQPLPQGDGNLFAPRLLVNDRVITEYEVIQRALFLQLLRAPVDPMAEALKALTDDRLRLDEADRLGVKLSEAQVLAAMDEFAARAELSGAQFIEALMQSGVEEATFRDFVSAGQAWRDVVRARYSGQVTITDSEVDEAINAAARDKPLRVLLSELVIPMAPGQETASRDLATRLSAEISGEGAFAAAARRNSRSPTAGSGGRLDWMPLSNLPPQIAPFVLALEAGQVSRPVFVPGAVVLFFLRDIAPDTAAKPASVQVEYAELVIPDQPEEIARLRAGADRCLDLFGLTDGLPESQLQIMTKAMGDVPQNVGLELAKLDPGEVSTALTRGNGRLFLMLCNRSPVLEEPISREVVRSNLLSRKLDGLANGYLEELRAAAHIRTP